MAVLLMTAPCGARLPVKKVIVLVNPRSRAFVGFIITSSGSMPSSVTSRARIFWRRSLCAHSSSDSPNVHPFTVRASKCKSPSSRKCNITSGTPPARKTWTVPYPTGPFGITSTKRGVCLLICIQSSTIGRGKCAAWAIAGMCSSKFVLPPNAACVTIALCNASGVSISRVVMPCDSISTNARAERRAISNQIG